MKHARATSRPYAKYRSTCIEHYLWRRGRVRLWQIDHGLWHRRLFGPKWQDRGGSIEFQGRELVRRSEAELRKLRGDQIAMVYQDPMQALNPSMRIGDQMSEVLIVHRNIPKAEAEAKCVQMLERVYMPDPANVMRRYPHQLSAGSSSAL